MMVFSDIQKRAAVEIGEVVLVLQRLERVKANQERTQILKAANDNFKKFKDVDGNNISEFFWQNGLDNHHLADEPAQYDAILMCKDEIKAILGDEKTLLKE